jgi:putative transposase
MPFVDNKKIRLRNYDYRQPGKYFVTIVAKQREKFFGEVKNKEMKLSEIGVMADRFWKEIPIHFTHARIHEFVVMPEHIHGIIEIVNPSDIPTTNQQRQFGPLDRGSLSMIINQFKAAVSRWCKKNGYINFCWQYRFNDHIIRDQKEFFAIRNYIKNNPINYLNDELQE